ncbi:putative START-like domain-containing protein [Rosa chinensis]|uniref:Putative START-like domain-containing protein n=1 Tax=Rosa chinensis TaxID=74649 RepID=A0A2P6R3F5_ROSCH|nr:putative START-like domain-containing protein [Rosa chinensis]
MTLSDTTSRGDQTYQVETLEEPVEIKASADEVYKVLSNQQHLIPEATSDHVQEVAVHEGDWETTGSVKVWKYTIAYAKVLPDNLIETVVKLMFSKFLPGLYIAHKFGG